MPVALWLESHVGERPLTFLDRRIRAGDSLVGVFDLRVLGGGIPDEAFKPLEGDDKETARMLGRRNRHERRGQRDLLAWKPAERLAAFSQASAAIEDIPDDTTQAVRRKSELFQARFNDPDWVREKEACDLWTAAFFQPLLPDAPAITSAIVLNRLQGKPPPPRALGIAIDLEDENKFFHWPLKFPEVFDAGGFDVLLSNPPWERVKLQEQEFFAVHDARIANAANKAERTKLIKALPETNPPLHSAYIRALRAAGAASAMLRHGGRFPLAGRGDINTYAVFAELGAAIINPLGRTGLILPTGIATDDTTKLFFSNIVQNRRLVEIIGFENEEFVFPAVHHFTRFCKLIISGTASKAQSAHLAFFIRRYSQLAEANRYFGLEPSDFALLSPNTGNCPIFRTIADAELTKAIYRRVPVLWREARDDRPEENPWRLSFSRMFDMANDSGLFRNAVTLEGEGYRLQGNIFHNGEDEYLPLYEVKMLHQFDHRFSTYEGVTQKQLNVGILPQPGLAQKQDPDYVVQPRYWVDKAEVDARIPRFPRPVASALQEGGEALRSVMALWAAGYHLNRGNGGEAARVLQAAQSESLATLMADAEGLEGTACALEGDFPLHAREANEIENSLFDPEPVAQRLIDRFSPKWLLGWRDITNNTNERTMIASALPRVGVGDKFLLMFSKCRPRLKLSLLAVLNSFAFDYVARQKIGGTSMKYFTMRQLAALPPNILSAADPIFGETGALGLISERAFDIIYTGNDLDALAQDYGVQHAPFCWDEDRRFALRCEIDAAFFHLYLPADREMRWRPSASDTSQELKALTGHFPAPRDAVLHIMEQFPTVRRRDELDFGSYRTRDIILEFYDCMQDAQRSGVP